MSLAQNEQSTIARPSLLLDAFIVAARHRGVHLSREQVLRDHQLKSPEITVPQTLRIARRAGMRGRSVRLRWQDLFKMGTALPAIVILRNGSAMVLLGVRPGRAGQPDLVMLADPGGGLVISPNQNRTMRSCSSSASTQHCQVAARTARHDRYADPAIETGRCLQPHHIAGPAPAPTRSRGCTHKAIMTPATADRFRSCPPILPVP